jgi:hypothetical protein
MMRRSLQWLAELLAVPLGLAASLGLIDALRSLPGPGLALALPLRETGHDDRASVFVVVGAAALVFALAAALAPARGRCPSAGLARSLAVLAGALVLEALSLQLVRQASVGLDWRAALGSPAPYACALGALLGNLAAIRLASSDRWRRLGPKEHPVDGRSNSHSLVKIGP